MSTPYKTTWWRVLLALLLPPVGFTLMALALARDQTVFAMIVVITLTLAAWLVALLWLPFHFTKHRHWGFALMLGLLAPVLFSLIAFAFSGGSDPAEFAGFTAQRAAMGLVVAALMWAVAYWNPRRAVSAT